MRTDPEYGDEVGRRLRSGSTRLTVDLDAVDAVRLAGRIRRRRRVTGLAGAVALVLGIGGGVYGIASTDHQQPSPATRLTATPMPPNPSAHPTTDPTTDPTSVESDPAERGSPEPPRRRTSGGPQSTIDQPAQATVSVQVADLPSGGPAPVNSVQNGVWRRPDGTTRSLDIADPDAYRGDFVAFDGGRRWGPGILGWTARADGTGSKTAFYGDDGGQHSLDLAVSPLSAPEDRLQPGPYGSVIWTDASTTENTLVIGVLWGRQVAGDYGIDRSYLQIPMSDTADADFVAGADAIFLADGRSVTKYPVAPSSSRRIDLGDGLEVPGYDDVSIGFPATDTVVLEYSLPAKRSDECGSPVRGSDLAPLWTSCTYTITGQSPDGRSFVGSAPTPDGGKQIAVIAADGEIPLAVQGIGGEAAVIDRDGGFTVHVTEPIGNGNRISEVRHTLVSCTMTGDCRRSSETSVGYPGSGLSVLTIADKDAR